MCFCYKIEDGAAPTRSALDAGAEQDAVAGERRIRRFGGRPGLQPLGRSLWHPCFKHVKPLNGQVEIKKCSNSKM